MELRPACVHASERWCMTVLRAWAYRAMTCHNGVHASLGGCVCACTCLCVTGGGWLHKSQGLDESLENSSSALLSPPHPEDSLKARRPELDEGTPQWSRLGCVEKEDKKKKKRGLKRHIALKPLFMFLSSQINGGLSLKQKSSFLSWKASGKALGRVVGWSVRGREATRDVGQE